jgi:hypothetical protein
VGCRDFGTELEVPFTDLDVFDIFVRLTGSRVFGGGAVDTGLEDASVSVSKLSGS